MANQKLTIFIADNGWAVEYDPGDRVGEQLVFLNYAKMIKYIDSVLEPKSPEPPNDDRLAGFI